MCLGEISSRAATALRSPLPNSAAFDEANAGVIQLGMTDDLGLLPHRRNEISPFGLNAVSGAPRRNVRSYERSQFLRHSEDRIDIASGRQLPPARLEPAPFYYFRVGHSTSALMA